MNKVILIGNVGQKPELRNTNSGTAVLQIRMATNDRVKRGDEWVDEPEWHSVTVFGKRAETCAQYLDKGSKVGVEGRIKTRKWQDKEGNDRYSTEIIADQIEFLSSRGQGGGSQGGGSRNQGGGGRGQGGGRDESDHRGDDPGYDPELPF